MKYLILMSILIIQSDLYSQSIYKAWYSDSMKTCLIIRNKENSEFFGEREIKIKIKTNKLIMSVRYGYFKKISAKFDIIKLTEDTLILSRLNYSKRYFEEVHADIIIFVVHKNNCLGILPKKDLWFFSLVGVSSSYLSILKCYYHSMLL